MHGLHTIQKLNEQAYARSVQRARSNGPVVVVYQGLHITRHIPCTDDTHAKQEAERIKREDGATSRCEILPKLTDAEAALYAGRDQSEDRRA